MTEYYALDYGNGQIVVVSEKTPDTFREYKNLVELVKDLPEGAILIAERSLSNFNRDHYNDALEEAEKRGIDLRGTSTHAVKNHRKEIGKPKPSGGRNTPEDVIDARILLHLFGPGSKRAYGIFKRWIERGKPEELRAAIKYLEIKARWQSKWVEEKKWLRKHKFPVNTVYACAVIAAREVLDRGLGRKDYKKFSRISEYGRANTILRSNGTYHIFKKSKKHDWSPKANRKVRLQEINRTINKIWIKMQADRERAERGDGTLPGM